MILHPIQQLWLIVLILVRCSMGRYQEPSSTSFISRNQLYSEVFPKAAVTHPMQPAFRFPNHIELPTTPTPNPASYHDEGGSYGYEYDVADYKTGDIKTQKEERIGDTVRGMYSVVEPDGSKRIVEYYADPHSGFNAIVRNEPFAHPQINKPLVQDKHQPHEHYPHFHPHHQIPHATQKTSRAYQLVRPAVKTYNPFDSLFQSYY